VKPKGALIKKLLLSNYLHGVFSIWYIVDHNKEGLRLAFKILP